MTVGSGVLLFLLCIPIFLFALKSWLQSPGLGGTLLSLVLVVMMLMLAFLLDIVNGAMNKQWQVKLGSLILFVSSVQLVLTGSFGLFIVATLFLVLSLLILWYLVRHMTFPRG